MKDKDIRKVIYENIGFIFIFVIAGMYIAWGFAQIAETEKTFWQIIADGTLSLTLGLSIKTLLRYQGLIWGEKDDTMGQTKVLYAKTIERAVPHFYKLGAFTEMKNEVAMKIVRTQILQRVGLRYSDYFDEDDKYIGVLLEGDTDVIKKQNTAIDSTIDLKITFLTPNDLTSDTSRRGKHSDPNDLGDTKEDFIKRGVIKQVASIVAVAVVFGYYTLKMVEEFNRGELIWKIVQITVFILGGLIEMFKSYYFITNDYRQGMIKKTNLLDEMILWEEVTPTNMQG